MRRTSPFGLRRPDDRFSSPAAVPLVAGRWIGAGIAGAIAADALLLLWAGLRISMSWASFGFVLWGAAAVAVCYACRAGATRAQRLARDLTESVSLFAAISLLGVIASYPLATVRQVFVDRPLEHIDLDLHFHWTSWYEVVVSHAWLQPIERIAYESIFVTPAILLAYFAWTERRAEARLFIATFGVAAVITLALFPLMPAAGPFATLWHGSAPYMPLSALYQDQVILALRHHAIHDVDLGAMHGLVCAPSFHAVSAVIYIGTAWRIAPLRSPITALNLAMLAATPVEGTHYLADLLAGALVALLALALPPILVRIRSQYAAGRSEPGWTALSVPAE